MKATRKRVLDLIFFFLIVLNFIIFVQRRELIFLFNIIFVGLMLITIRLKRNECYCQDCDEYDYDRENPNALVTGKNIAGTVFASYPNSTPGLGWVL